MRPPGELQTLSRALALLRAVADAREEGLRLTDLVEVSGMHRATVHRLLGALVHEGLVRKLDSRRFTLGSEAWALGYAAFRVFDIKRIARPSLDRLADNPGDVAFLQIRSGPSAICLDRADGQFPIRPMTLQPDERRPLGVGAGSLALLAALPDEEVEEILSSSGERLKPFPLFTPERLREMVEETRAAGFARVRGEVVAEAFALAVAVLDHEARPIASLSCAAIRSRLNDERAEEALRVLREEAARIEQSFRPQQAKHGRSRP